MRENSFRTRQCLRFRNTWLEMSLPAPITGIFVAERVELSFTRWKPQRYYRNNATCKRTE